MNSFLFAALPIFGLLASLFVGFHYVAFSESRSAEQIAYLSLAAGVVWLLVTGAILWPEIGAPGALHHHFDPLARFLPRAG